MDRVTKRRVRRREGMICQWIKEKGRNRKKDGRGGWEGERGKRKEITEE